MSFLKSFRIYIINNLIEILLLILFFNRTIRHYKITKKKRLCVRPSKMGKVQKNFLPEMNAFIQDIHLDQYKRLATAELLSRQNIRERGFSFNIYDLLKESEKIRLLEIALSNKIIDEAVGYFKFPPFLTGIQLIYNIPRAELSQEGSKCWHRDGNVLKEFDVFTILSEVDTGSGPLYFLTDDNVGFHQTIRAVRKGHDESPWARGRIADDQMNLYVGNDGQVGLTGSCGDTVMIDASRTYHKGGFCRGNDRLMFRCYFGLKGASIHEDKIFGISSNNDYFRTLRKDEWFKFNLIFHSKSVVRNFLIDRIYRMDKHTKIQLGA